MSVVLYDDGEHKCIAFSDLVSCGDEWAEDGETGVCDSVQATQFLIIHQGHAVLIDPGGNLTYSRLFMAVSEYVQPKNLEAVIASHQDPDIVASLNKWLVGTRCKVIVPELWRRFVPHFCNPGATKGRLFGIPDEGMDIQVGACTIKALPAHFLHSEGNFHFYDPISRILFTGDLGASLIHETLCAKPVKDFEQHVKTMEGFHRRYMNANKVLRFWVNMVRGLELDMIVPQHGAFFQGQKSIEQFLDWLETLRCGSDIVTQDHYRVPGHVT